MKRAAVFICLMASSVLFGLTRLGAEAAKRERSPLEGVPELQRQVTYSETKIALGDLVKKLAAETGVPLSAASDVADEPVSVVVREFPARELLEQLADLLDYRWSRRGVGQAVSLPGGKDRQANSLPHYEIWQDLASKQREGVLRQATSTELQRRLQEELRRALQMAALPPAEIQHIIDSGLAHQRELEQLPQEQQRTLSRSPEEKERSRRLNAALSVSAPISRVLANLLARLSSEQWTRLRRDEELWFSSDPQPGEARLPAQFADLLRAAQPTYLLPALATAEREPDPRSSERVRRRDQEMQPQWASATGFRVLVRLIASRSSEGRTLALGASALPIQRGAGLPATFTGGLGTRLDLMVSQATGEDEAKDPSRTEAPSDGAPLLRAKKLFRPQAKPYLSSGEAASPSRWWRFRDLLPDIARTYDVPIIADAYWQFPPFVRGPVAANEPVALGALLDRIADFRRWDHRGGLIRFRSRAWFFERPREVPLRLVRRWQQLYEARGALPLDAYVAMVSALTPAQRDALGHLHSDAGSLPDFYWVWRARRALHLYASLTPRQRAGLWQGSVIPVAEMTRSQRGTFFEELRELNRTATTPLDMASAAAGSFALELQRLESHNPPERKASPTSQDGPSAPGSVANARQPEPNPTLTRVRFHFRAAPGAESVAELTVAAPP